MSVITFVLRLRLVRPAAAATAALFSFAVATGGGLAAASKPPPTVGEKTSEALVQIRQLQSAKDWVGILQVLDRIPGVQPGSYDEALILDMKARIFGMTEQVSRAVAPWERALQLSDQHGYFPERQTLEMVLFLAQVHLQEAGSGKDPARQQQHLAKALTYFRRFLERTPKPSPEALMTYASALFHQAIADPNKPNQALLAEARTVIDRGLTSAITPKEGFYQLLLPLLQQQNDLEGATDVLELLLKQKPDRKDYWQALIGFYQQLWDKTTKEKMPWLAQEYLVRAIVTLERAQGHGFLNGPKENLHLVSLYLQANQFTTATQLLHDGLKGGRVESEPNNWRLLARYYQETNLNDRAIAVLQEAAARFPQSGEIEIQLAQLFVQMEKTEDALARAKAAAATANFETTKPFSVQYLIAFLAYDLGRIDEAQKAIASAERYPEEAAKDAQFPKLKTVIAEAIAERELRARPPQRTAAAAPEAPRRP